MKCLILLFLLLIPNITHAKMIEGKLVELSTGAIFELKIQKKIFGSKGKIEATFNNGEKFAKFTGEYVGIRQKENNHAFIQSYNGNKNHYGTVSSTSQKSVVPAQATLTNEELGVVIQCNFTIQAGISPHGFGNCRDNRGSEYSLAF